MSIAEQLIQAKADLDAVYAAGKAAGSPKNRKVYTGKIEADVVGTADYATLVQDTLLAKNRSLDTLFVRVESDITEPKAYTVVKTWAANNAQTVPTSDLQRIHRWGSSANYDTAGNSIRLDSTDEREITGKVGLVNITEDGKLNWYSGSNGNFYIRPCNFKVIVEW